MGGPFHAKRGQLKLCLNGLLAATASTLWRIRAYAVIGRVRVQGTPERVVLRVSSPSILPAGPSTESAIRIASPERARSRYVIGPGLGLSAQSRRYGRVAGASSRRLWPRIMGNLRYLRVSGAAALRGGGRFGVVT